MFFHHDCSHPVKEIRIMPGGGYKIRKAGVYFQGLARAQAHAVKTLCGQERKYAFSPIVPHSTQYYFCPNQLLIERRWTKIVCLQIIVGTAYK